MQSVSRLMPQLAEKAHWEQAGRLRDLMATYQSSEDLINIGAYTKGSNPKIDQAIRYKDSIKNFLKQNIHESVTFEKTIVSLKTMLS